MEGPSWDFVFWHIFCLEGQKRSDLVTKTRASCARCVGGPNYCFARSERARDTPTAASAVADMHMHMHKAPPGGTPLGGADRNRSGSEFLPSRSAFPWSVTHDRTQGPSPKSGRRWMFFYRLSEWWEPRVRPAPTGRASSTYQLCCLLRWRKRA